MSVFLCFIKVKLCVKVKFFVLLSWVRALPGKAIPERSYTVSGGMLNPTQSLNSKLVKTIKALSCQGQSPKIDSMGEILGRELAKEPAGEL